MEPTQVLDAEGQYVGIYRRSIGTHDGPMMLIDRDKRLGGGTIVVPERQAEEQDTRWQLPYGELSMREAPPYSPNVDISAYFAFWERLGPSNTNSSLSEYRPTGSGLVPSERDVPDYDLLEAVTAVLHDSGGRVNLHTLQVSVKQGTVLLEGYQNDTMGRSAAAEAAASVLGVKEIVNMLVIRPM